jgi:carbonic anhydrase
VCEACNSPARMISRRQLVQVAGAGGAILATIGLSRFDRGTVLAADDATPAAATEHVIHWGYEGEEGPEYWGELDPSYATCSGGTAQSPINVTKAMDEDLPNIAFSYQIISPLHIINNGHTIQVNVPAGSGITLDGKEYALQQFHFHTPSEHTIDGQGQAMELHLVNKAEDGGIAVVGVLLSEGEQENAAFQPVFAAMPTAKGPEQEVTGSVDPNALLPETKTTYRYMGSLTTPPCTEGVHWLLMTEPVSLSSAQVEAFRSIFELDARPVQPLNGREIEEDTTG